MSTLLFDTLDFAERAIKAGFTREQAEFQAREAAAAIETKLATRDDITEVHKQIGLTRRDFIKEIKLVEHRMTIKFGAMLVASIGILVTVLQFFK